MITLYVIGQFTFWAVVGYALLSIARSHRRGVTVMRDQLNYEQAREVREEERGSVEGLLNCISAEDRPRDPFKRWEL